MEFLERSFWSWQRINFVRSNGWYWPNRNLKCPKLLWFALLWGWTCLNLWKINTFLVYVQHAWRKKDYFDTWVSKEQNWGEQWTIFKKTTNVSNGMTNTTRMFETNMKDILKLCEQKLGSPNPFQLPKHPVGKSWVLSGCFGMLFTPTQLGQNVRPARPSYGSSTPTFSGSEAKLGLPKHRLEQLDTVYHLRESSN